MAPSAVRRDRFPGRKRAPRPADIAPPRPWTRGLLTSREAGLAGDEAGSTRPPRTKPRVRARQVLEEDPESESGESEDSEVEVEVDESSDDDTGPDSGPSTPIVNEEVGALPDPSPDPLPPAPLPTVEDAQPNNPTTTATPSSPPPPANDPLSSDPNSGIPGLPEASLPDLPPPPPLLDVPLNDGAPDGAAEDAEEEEDEEEQEEEDEESDGEDEDAEDEEPQDSSAEPSLDAEGSLANEEDSPTGVGAVPDFSDSASPDPVVSTVTATPSAGSSGGPGLAYADGTVSSWGPSATATEAQDDGRELDPDTEHALIAVGAIGSFILACSICWVIWNQIKRSGAKTYERRMQAYSSDVPPPPPPKERGYRAQPGIVGRIRGLRNMGTGSEWRNLEDNRRNEPPPQYEKGRAGSSQSSQSSLRLDTTFYSPDPKATANQPQNSSTYMSPPTDSQPSARSVSPTSTMGRSNTTGTTKAQGGTFTSTDHYMLDPVAAEFAAKSTDHDPTSKHPAVEVHAIRSELGGGPSEAARHSRGHRLRHQRMSDMSSMSSGFGDADIVVPSMTSLRHPPPAAQDASRLTEDSYGGDRYSWASRGGNSRRETVLTEASEDMPPRFRTVNSWVNQQTGRVKRAQARAEDEENPPPVPALPPEQRFDLMMPDGEEPRRPDGYKGPQ